LAASLIIALVLAAVAAGFGWKAWKLASESEARSLEEAALLREQAYVSDVYLASRALSDNQLGVAREMLARHGDGSDSASLRGFEWYALSKIAEGDPARIFKDHSAEVRALAIDPSVRFFLSAGRDGRVVMRGLESGEVVLSLPRDDAPKEAGEIPLMAILTAKSPEAKALLFSGETSMDEMRMRGRPSKLGELQCAAWSPDGKILVTGGDGCYLRLWSFPEGKMVGYLPQHPTRKVWFSDDGQFIISLVGHGPAHELRVYDVKTLARVWNVEGVEGGVAVSGDEVVVVKHPEMRMTVLGLSDGKERRSWRAEGVANLAFVEDGTVLHGVSGDRRSQLLWDAKSGDLMKRVASADGVINSLLGRPGGSVIAGEGQVVRIQDSELKEVGGFRGHGDEIMALAERGNWLISGGKDRTVRVWKGVDEESGSPFLSPPGSTILGLSEDGETWLMDTLEAVEVWNRSGLKRRIEGELRGLGFAADAKSFATWRKEGIEAVIEWWDLGDSPARDSFRLKLSTKDKWVFGWSRDGARAAVSVGDRYVRVFDPRDGSELGEITGLTLMPMRIIFSPNGEDIAFYGWPWSVQVGSVERGLTERWRISAGSIGPVVFSPDGEVFAAGGDENKIIVRDLLTGEVVSELKGHKGQINALAFSPDGKTLVSASSDRSLRLWHVPTWRDLGVLDEGSFHGYIGFDREGKRLTVLPQQGKNPFAIPGWE
jgi:WD40 repeat protein